MIDELMQESDNNVYSCLRVELLRFDRRKRRKIRFILEYKWCSWYRNKRTKWIFETIKNRFKNSIKIKEAHKGITRKFWC